MNKYLLSLVTFLIPILNFAQETSEKGLDQQIDEAFKPFSDLISSIVYFEIFEGAPFVIILLVGSALFFSLYFGFPNFRYFLTSINIVRGKKYLKFGKPKYNEKNKALPTNKIITNGAPSKISKKTMLEIKSEKGLNASSIC